MTSENGESLPLESLSTGFDSSIQITLKMALSSQVTKFTETAEPAIATVSVT